MSDEAFNFSKQRLKSFVQRIESLEEDIAGKNEDKRDVYKEAKSLGYCTKTLKKAIQRRRFEPSKRREEDDLLELYEEALSE